MIRRTMDTSTMMMWDTSTLFLRALRRLCYKLIFMMQAAQDRPSHDLQVRGKIVPMCLQCARQVQRQLWNAWSQRHMRAPCIVMRHPCAQQVPQVVFCRGDHEVQTFASERA